MNTVEIENLLRMAPKPAPPAGLKERLIAQVRLPAISPAVQATVRPLAGGSWLRRWWPVLVPATASLACAVGLSLQQMEIRSLRQAIEGLSHDSGPKAGAVATPDGPTNGASPRADAAVTTQQEIARLKELAGRLTAEVAQLERMRAENANLRAQLAAPPAGFLTPEETEALAKAKERAEAIQCVNNLKQLGLAVRLWSLDNGDASPPDVLAMTNEISTPKILACPGDHARQAAKDWASYTAANCSYEYLAPSTADIGAETERVMFRCPVHGTVGLCDGSVQRLAKDHPELLVQRDGKLYFAPPPQPAPDAPAQPSANPPPGGSPP